MQRRALSLAIFGGAQALVFACGGGGLQAGAGQGGAAAGQAGGTAAGSGGMGGTVASTGGAGGSPLGGGQAGTAGVAMGGANGGVNMGGAAMGGGGAGGAPPKQTGTPLVYLGGNGNYPLRVYELDKSSGKLTQRGGDEDGGGSPSYLALDPSRTHLYNCNEDGGQAAGVTAHHIKADGTLEPLNHQQGSDQCNGSCGFTHVAVDPTGKYVVAASYDGGSISVFPINQDGSLGAEKQLLDFGNGAEAHSVTFDATGQFAFVPTLGADKVQQLKLGADGKFAANMPGNVAEPKNTGPRHAVMHPDGKHLFVINETASSMMPYALSADGKLTAGTVVSTLPAGFNGESYGQHVEISPDGRFLYGSNVGHDSIVVFSIDAASGNLTPIQDQPSGGAWPRDFDMDPNGEFLVVANRDSNDVAVLKIGMDGKLSPLGSPTKVPDGPTSVVIRYQP